ncbi:hypothetical protein Ocin01_06650 [Orchesella cincta]|uniref:Uncharacterized protein n=1 Tax=Orchesella cincta TaxID=48709 RepID=A0A1D2N508_ORCCI|nr:hypothetical protein Ocin01_06650 [Orchesella cincta]
MNLQKLLACTVAVFLIVFSSPTSGAKPGRPLHLREPLEELSTKLQAVIKNFNIFKLISAIGEIGLGCLLPPESELATFTNLIPIDVNYLSLLAKSEPQSINPIFWFTQKQLAEYCESPDFTLIHEHLWLNDTSTRDLVEFFYYNEYPKIYETIRDLYYENSCPSELIATLPTGPGQPKTNTYPLSSNLRDEIGKSKKKSFIKQEEGDPCSLLEILKKIESTGLFELLYFIESFVYQFSTQPSLHFMVAKIQEDVKGVSFRKFRLMQPVRKLFDGLHQSIVSSPNIEVLLLQLKELTGIDLIATNIVETVATILETVVWGNSDSIPPYNPNAVYRYEEEYVVFY